MEPKALISNSVTNTLINDFDLDFPESKIVINETRKEFDGEFTIVCFPFTKALKKAPHIIAEEIGSYLKKRFNYIEDFNVVKGFLNISLSNEFWIDYLKKHTANRIFKKQSSKIVVEYSSPNTNKPLHLGHIRNNLLGKAICNILKEAGNDVIETNLVNDRGIHICKSMLAWKLFGNNETPENACIKGDHLVGKYYVKFDQEYKKQIQNLIDSGLDELTAKSDAPIMAQAREMLVKWENKDPETRKLWEEMNNWVYSGFDLTYKRMGISFDSIIYESNTYLLGKNIVSNSGQCYQKEDGSIWIDLSSDGLDHKLLLRSDGTSVYMTQDIGTAQLRYDKYKMDRSVYVVGNEQEYHFNALKAVLNKFGKTWSDGIHHLSYGMVDLPSGKMKSREGTVVDADDLLQEMHDTAKAQTTELGKIDSFSEEDAYHLYETIGLGALKFYLLKVDPKKRILFDPEDSIDFQGFTGPFIQYTHARINSMLVKHGKTEPLPIDLKLSNIEIQLCVALSKYQEALEESALQMSPAIMANYCFEIAKAFNRYYAQSPILAENDLMLRNLRITLCQSISKTLVKGMGLLGIELPDKM